jgi:hypothetical protein
MRFEEAVMELKKGKKIKRPNQYYLILGNYFLEDENGRDALLITVEDIKAEDWEVIDD